MHIYIDESGNFAVPQNGSTGFSCVGALVIRSDRIVRLSRDFRDVSRKWSQPGKEIKGCDLDEPRIQEILQLLERSGSKLFVAASAGSMHSNEDLREYRDAQANHLGAHITPSHHPNPRKQVQEIQVKMRKMSAQEFLQFAALAQVTENVLRVIPNHFSFTAPKELGEFKWRVDEKSQGRSSLEVCWSLLRSHFLQSSFIKKPVRMRPDGDTRFFDAAFLDSDQKWPTHLPPRRPSGRKSGGIFNLAKMMRNFEFKDSKTRIGLQLADIAINAFRRAARGGLSDATCEQLGALLLSFEDQVTDLFYLEGERPRTHPAFPKEIHRKLQIMEKAALSIGSPRWCQRHARHLVASKTTVVSTPSITANPTRP